VSVWYCLDVNPAFAKAWLAQRTKGDAAVAAVVDDELASMTEEEALARIDALLELGATNEPAPDRVLSSGFVAQQRAFALAREPSRR